MRLDLDGLGLMRGGTLGVALAIAGCSGEASRPEQAGPPEVYGGYVDTAHPAVAYLLGSTEQGDTVGDSTCTGTLIAPTVILTAGHCAQVYGRDTKRALFESEPGSSKWIDIVDFRTPPQFDSHAPTQGFDVAVALLAEPAPVAPLPYNRNPLNEGLVGQPLRVVGYGWDDDEVDDAYPQIGTKRQALVELSAFTDTLLESGNLAQHTLGGDSGGPALMSIQGVETIVGVLSYGEQSTDQPMGLRRVHRQFHTRVDRYTDFVDAFLKLPWPAPQD